ncbi:sprouty-related, EVH1 domain-containing protein 3 isoform X1 [Lepisosteus oculatus]|uniref:sprouty-related, EVH1 domain-containing protein 3 isoform X1 n=1 Tax=Lepisosteus oculatus TaxID=7918 RepID=UPI00371EA019
MERDVVRVRAVVMTRDDSSGGWVPLGGGGLSHVIICKGRSLEDRGRRDYIIRGERLRDRAPVLECAVQRGLVYNKVNPIFHHWRVQDKKFGLTFQSPADAVSFERGLHSAIDRLDRGSDSPSSSTPEEGDTEDDGLAVSRSVSLSPSVLCECVSLSLFSLRLCGLNTVHQTSPVPPPHRPILALFSPAPLPLSSPPSLVPCVFHFFSSFPLSRSLAQSQDSESSSSSRKEMLPRPATIVTSQSSATCFVRPPATEDYGYGTGHTVATPTPAQIHTRPLQHQPAPVTAVINPPAPPPPAQPPPPPLPPPQAPPPAPPLSPLSPLSPTLSLLEEKDLQSLDPCKDLWGSRGYEDYRRAGTARTLGVPAGGGGGVGGSGAPDKAELCVVRFEKELAGGPVGSEVAVTLDSKPPLRLATPSPTCGPGPNAVGATPASGPAGPCAHEPGKGSPSPCCIHTSLATPRARTRKRGGGGGGDCGLGLGLGLAGGLSPTLDAAVSCADEDHAGPCPPPGGSSSSSSSRCVYCRSVFSAADNGRGRCRDAPDPALRCLRQWTCVWCAESLLYHCMSDSEGEFWEPCSCEEDAGGGGGGGEGGGGGGGGAGGGSGGCRPHALCCARWLALLALSLVVPCMCCYLPLRACLRCGEHCGCCGGRHKAVR